MDEKQRLFFETWGNRFVAKLKENLMRSYAYAPGSTGSQPELQVGDAYSEGRKGEYNGKSLRGSASKLASSTLYNSIVGNVVDDGFELFMEDYWEYVNYGRTRGFYVPISPLEKWAQLKGFEDPRGAAFGISRNIFRFGIAPTFFFDNTINELQAQFDSELAEQLDKSFTDFFDSLLIV